MNERMSPQKKELLVYGNDYSIQNDKIIKNGRISYILDCLYRFFT
jgi:hypothetical protein